MTMPHGTGALCTMPLYNPTIHGSYEDFQKVTEPILEALATDASTAGKATCPSCGEWVPAHELKGRPFYCHASQGFETENDPEECTECRSLRD